MRTNGTRISGTLRTWHGGKAFPGLFLAAAVALGSGCDPMPEAGAGEVAQEASALCTGCAPPPVTPPTASASATVPASGEVGNAASLTSPASPSGAFVGSFQGLVGKPNQFVSIEQTAPPVNTDVCSRTGTSATVYAHSKSLGYWYVLDTIHKAGSWVPASGFIPAHCDTGAGLAIKTSDIDKVIVSGYSTFCWYGTCWYRQVTQSVAWHY